MPEVYLASSALVKDQFEGKRTIEEAARYGFDGVQLYLDPRYRRAEYCSQVATVLQQSGLGVVFHLPNMPTPDDFDGLRRMAQELPKQRTVLHYLPATNRPKIDGAVIGWENSVTGRHDAKHIRDVFNLSCREGTFFAFDFGRSQFTEAGEFEKQAEILTFIRRMLSKLNPKKDIIHLADKKTWEGNFRDVMCALGQGICRVLIDDLRKFSGVVVMEHEDLQMAVDSIDVLR